MDVGEPTFERYREDGPLMFVYELAIHQFDSSTRGIYGQAIIGAYEEDLEPIDEYTATRFARENLPELGNKL